LIKLAGGKIGNHPEIDEFYGENKGLVVAEIELHSEDETFENQGWERK
jgi:adenylate cyclase